MSLKMNCRKTNNWQNKGLWQRNNIKQFRQFNFIQNVLV